MKRLLSGEKGNLECWIKAAPVQVEIAAGGPYWSQPGKRLMANPAAGHVRQGKTCRVSRAP